MSRTTAILSLIKRCAKNAGLVVYGPSYFPGKAPPLPDAPGVWERLGVRVSMLVLRILVYLRFLATTNDEVAESS